MLKTKTVAVFVVLLDDEELSIKYLMASGLFFGNIYILQGKKKGQR